MSGIQHLLHPDWFQGAGRPYPYFEGWYYKVVDRAEQQRYAIIAGLYVGPSPQASHCFVQFLDGLTGQVDYFRYPAASFVAAPDRLDVQLGPNRFRAQGLQLALDGDRRSVKGELAFGPLTPWPRTIVSPGAMGWFAWIPWMECYHGVVSLDHSVTGTLWVDGQAMAFDGGRGYTEKDWGRRFPAAWIWFQSNHWNPPHVSVMLSVARIPWLGGQFRGFIIGVWCKGKLHRMATYTGARIERLRVATGGRIEVVVADRQRRLELELRGAEPGSLYAPDVGDMTGRVGETLAATAHMRLLRGQRNRFTALYEGEARLGALEVVGDMRVLGAA